MGEPIGWVGSCTNAIMIHLGHAVEAVHDGDFQKASDAIDKIAYVIEAHRVQPEAPKGEPHYLTKLMLDHLEDCSKRPDSAEFVSLLQHQAASLIAAARRDLNGRLPVPASSS